MIDLHFLSINRGKFSRLSELLLLILFVPACYNQRKTESNHLICNNIYAQLDENTYIVTRNGSYMLDSFQPNNVANLRFSIISSELLDTHIRYSWDIENNELIELNQFELEFPLPCDCEASVIDQSSDGQWQIVDIRNELDDGTIQYSRWLIGNSGYYSLANSLMWKWSTDGHYLSVLSKYPTPIGTMSLIDLETLSSFDITYDTDLGDVPLNFPHPSPLAHNVVFSELENLYYYRSWFEEDRDKVYIYDPIRKKGQIERVENVISITYSEFYGQIFYALLDGDFITIKSTDALISASLPYELFSELNKDLAAARLAHIPFYLSPSGDFLITYSDLGMVAIGCTEL